MQRIAFPYERIDANDLFEFQQLEAQRRARCGERHAEACARARAHTRACAREARHAEQPMVAETLCAEVNTHATRRPDGAKHAGRQKSAGAGASAGASAGAGSIETNLRQSMDQTSFVPHLDLAECGDADPTSESVCFACGENQPKFAACFPSGRMCCHSGCEECVEGYFKSNVTAAKVRCWDPQCKAVWPIEQCGKLLGFTSDAFDRLSQASNLAGLKLDCCPTPGCGYRFEAPTEQDGGWPKAQCVKCQGVMCVPCKTTWHNGYTCEQYQRLPTHLRNPGDVAALNLASRSGWSHCPGCDEMVERADGCNFIQCRCGTGFCYLCGKPYTSLLKTPRNSHGTPGCDCGLFGGP